MTAAESGASTPPTGSSSLSEPPVEPPRGAGGHETPHVPPGLFWLQLIYLAVLIGLFIMFETWTDFRDALPADLGPLPVEVPWFGALGGSLISLTGIFQHSCNWNDCYKYWHYSRPFVGGVIGSLGALVFFVLSDTATSGAATAVNATAFDVVAFLVGYREESFRELIKRATDLVLRPADTPPTQASGGGGPATPTPASPVDQA